jgi:hypothetical protein
MDGDWRIARAWSPWNQWDFLSLLASMGHVGQNSMLEAMQQQIRLAAS